ncbi:MAG: hypothetical protein JWQ65_448 [Devosia sp.]|nr:hypothetical protein [Devosia sp.]
MRESLGMGISWVRGTWSPQSRCHPGAGRGPSRDADARRQIESSTTTTLRLGVTSQDGYRPAPV